MPDTAVDDPLIAGLLASDPPVLDATEAAAILHAHWGIAAEGRDLACERDRNFHMTASDGRGFALKVSNPVEPAENTNLQTEALRWLAAADPDLPLPRVVPTASGATEPRIDLPRGEPCIVRLLTWREGTPLVKAGVGGNVVADIGRIAARLSWGLNGFHHPHADHGLLWDIRNAPRLRPLLADVAPELRDRLEAELDRYEADVLPRLAPMRRQVVHNDLNHHNLVVDPGAPARISGVIDFGDIVETHLIADVAVAASYLTHLEDDPVAPVARMLAAYHQTFPLEWREVAVLRDLIVARLLTSIVITEWRAARYPDNADYILRNNGPARDGFAAFGALDRGAVTARLLAACGME